MKFNPLSTLMSLYWASVGVLCGYMAYTFSQETAPWRSIVIVPFSLFLLYGAVRLLMREKPYTWKRERPFWLFMTKEERHEDFKRW